MDKRDVRKFLRDKPGYAKTSAYKLSEILNCDEGLCFEALQEIRRKKDFKYKENKTNIDVIRESFNSNKNPKIEVKRESQNKSSSNVLIIGDLHEPFCMEGYLSHCLDMYKKYKCNKVVFIGDIIDNHASSYHETDPDGHSAGYELKLAIRKIQKWHNAFPNATVIIGNHDRLIMRKAYTSGLSKLWIKDYADVLKTPGWEFKESEEIDGVLYIHGEGGTARVRARRDMQSVVQGHLHTQAYVEWVVGNNSKIFAMQVGCGIDEKSYSMAYAKNYAKPALGCGVVLEGSTAINCMM